MPLVKLTDSLDPVCTVGAGCLRRGGHLYARRSNWEWRAAVDAVHKTNDPGTKLWAPDVGLQSFTNRGVVVPPARHVQLAVFIVSGGVCNVRLEPPRANGIELRQPLHLGQVVAAHRQSMVKHLTN